MSERTDFMESWEALNTETYRVKVDGITNLEYVFPEDTELGDVMSIIIEDVEQKTGRRVISKYIDPSQSLVRLYTASRRVESWWTL